MAFAIRRLLWPEPIDDCHLLRWRECVIFTLQWHGLIRLKPYLLFAGDFQLWIFVFCGFQIRTQPLQQLCLLKMSLTTPAKLEVIYRSVYVQKSVALQKTMTRISPFYSNANFLVSFLSKTAFFQGEIAAENVTMMSCVLKSLWNRLLLLLYDGRNPGWR